MNRKCISYSVFICMCHQLLWTARPAPSSATRGRGGSGRVPTRLGRRDSWAGWAESCQSPPSAAWPCPHSQGCGKTFTAECLSSSPVLRGRGDADLPSVRATTLPPLLAKQLFCTYWMLNIGNTVGAISGKVPTRREWTFYQESDHGPQVRVSHAPLVR